MSILSRHGVPLSFMLVVVGCASPAGADKVTLKSGRIIDGIVEGNTSTQVTIRTPAGLLSFPASSVAKLQRETVSKNYAVKIEQLLAKGELESALPLLHDNETSLGALLSKHGDAIVHRAHEHSPTTAEQLRGRIDEGNEPAAQLFLALYLAKRSQYSDALERLTRVPVDEWRSNREQCELALQTIATCGEWLLQNPDSRLSAAAFSLLNRLQGSVADASSTTLLQFRAAQELARRGRVVEGVQLTASIKGPNLAVLMRPHLDSILQKAEAQGNTSATAEATSFVLANLSEWYGETGKQKLYQKAAFAYANSGNFPAASLIADQLADMDADAGAELQHQVEYLSRRAGISEDDALAQYKLALWAKEMGLLDQAGTLLGPLQTNPILAENVRLQLQLLEIDRGRIVLAGLRKQYEAGEFEKVQKALQEFRARFANSELQQKAQELSELARYRQWSARQRMPSQAEAAYQHAERLYNQGQLDSALNHALKVITEYTDTPSADKAATLRDRIQKEMSKKKARQ